MPTTKATESKIEKGAVCSLLEGKDVVERARIKAQEFAKKEHPGRFAAHGVEIEITSPRAFGQVGFEVIARVWRNGQELSLGNINPIRVINPPILVPDGTKSEIELPFGDGVKLTQVDNYKEDLDEALKQIVGEHLRVVLKLRNE